MSTLSQELKTALETAVRTRENKDELVTVLEAAGGGGVTIGNAVSGSTPNTVLTVNGSGNLANTSLTASRALASNSSGIPVAATTTATELGFVNGVTSAIQTQFTGKASTTLNNLGTTAVNAIINPAADGSTSIGSDGKRFTFIRATQFTGNNSQSTFVPSTGIITDGAGSSVDAVTRVLFDAGILDSIHWDARSLHNSSGTNVFSWSDVVRLRSSLITPIRLTTIATTLSATTDYKLVCDKSSIGDLDITLPAGVDGLTFCIGQAATNTVLINLLPNGGDLVDSSASTSVNNLDGTSITYLSGTWYAI